MNADQGNNVGYLTTFLVLRRLFTPSCSCDGGSRLGPVELWSAGGPLLGYCVPEPGPAASVLPAGREQDQHLFCAPDESTLLPYSRGMQLP